MAGRKSQKAGGNCSYVNQNKPVRKSLKKSRRSQRAGGGCGYTGDKRAGVRRSQKAGARKSKHRKSRLPRKAKTQKKKGFVVICEDAGCTGRK